MKFDRKQLLLYAVTDQSFGKSQPLEEQVKEALEAGVTFLQLREKELDEESFLNEAIKIKALTDYYHVPFVINDDVDIAKKCDADGVHVGQSDMEIVKAREVLGSDKIIGVSVQTVEQAKLAQSQGADYLGVGAVFATSTKQDAKSVSYATLKQICESVSIPVVAIGGIFKDNVEKLEGTKISGIAVVSAIFGSDDIRQATKNLLKKAKDIIDV